MNDPHSSLSIDDAVAEFYAIVREELGTDFGSGGAMPLTPAEMEDSRFRFAEFMLSLACPDPRACADRRCQRNALCRHFGIVQAKRASGKSRNPRRTPGAEAARYAIWAYITSGR